MTTDMNIEFIIRIFIAAILGGAIGLEREYRAKEAGLRTHFLVALGSALFMILSEYGFGDVLAHMGKASFDPSRIASQVVTGIGFIGAGTIIFQKHVVRGLTTAAGLWVTSAIGLTCGAGMYILSGTATILVLICLETLNFFFKKIGTRSISIAFSSPNKESIKSIMLKLKEENTDIDSYEMQEKDTSEGKTYNVRIEMKVKREKYQEQILNFITKFDGINIEDLE